MNPLLLYCVRAGASLTLLYGCYRLFLARLTFYRANRYYLVAAILLSVLVPLMDTSAFWPEPVASYTVYVAHWTDALPNQTPVVHTVEPTPQTIHIPWITLIFLMGVACMAVRLLLQVFSLGRLRKRSKLLSREAGIRLYAVPEPVVPFSFWRSIYIHEQGFTSEDLRRIIEHETAHVHERHTLDILLLQALLLVQWWNPVAWLLNRAVRQNLEFLADEFVLSQGEDRRAYQYLLLKASGTQVPPLVNSFTFSPLRNRIAMMNRNHSSKRQTARFIVALPLLLVLLAAFARKVAQPATLYHYIGIVIDAKTLKPLDNVRVSHEGKQIAVSDSRGYFKFDFPIPAGNTFTTNLEYVRSDYQPQKSTVEYAPNGSMLEFIAMTPKDSNYTALLNKMSLDETDAAALAASDGKAIDRVYNEFVHAQKTLSKLRAQFRELKDIYFVTDGRAYITDGHGLSGLDGPDHMVIVDDTLVLTSADVNKRYRRDQLDVTLGSFSRQLASRKYGIDNTVFALYLKKN